MKNIFAKSAAARKRMSLCISFSVWLASILLAPAAETNDSLLVIGAGAGQVGGFIHGENVNFGYVEYRPSWRFHWVGTWIMAEVADREFYSAAGLLVNLPLGDRWRLTPSSGVGYFSRRGVDLGYPIEFRSGIELSYGIGAYGRLGANYTHVSNADLGSKNPGMERVALVWAIPTGPRNQSGP